MDPWGRSPNLWAMELMRIVYAEPEDVLGLGE